MNNMYLIFEIPLFILVFRICQLEFCPSRSLAVREMNITVLANVSEKRVELTVKL